MVLINAKINYFMSANHINPINIDKLNSTPKEVFEEYIENGMCRDELAKEFGVCKTSIGNRLKELGLHTSRNYNKMAKFNIHKFDVIDTEEKAYWLGFLYADGAIIDYRNCVELRLAEVDYGHLVKFKKFLEDTRDDTYIKHIVKSLNGKEFKQCAYIVYNVHFTQALIKLGCFARKSLILKFPDENLFTNRDLIYDFIRGYVDGDGCISKEGKDRLSISLLGTYDFLSGVKRYLPYFGSVIKQKNVYGIRCTRNKGDQAAYRLYENATIYLDRKFLRYATLCRLHNSETSDKIGESCDANAEVTPEIAKGLESTVENSE
jgi:hypothetical protein